jgi:hypothetical protein
VEIFEEESLQASDKILLSRNLERYSKTCKLFSVKMIPVLARKRESIALKQVTKSFDSKRFLSSD